MHENLSSELIKILERHFEREKCADNGFEYILLDLRDHGHMIFIEYNHSLKIFSFISDTDLFQYRKDGSLYFKIIKGKAYPIGETLFSAKLYSSIEEAGATSILGLGILIKRQGQLKKETSF